MQRLLFLLVCLLSACASTGDGGLTLDEPVSLRMRDYRQGQDFTLVNDAWLRGHRVEGTTREERRVQFNSHGLPGGNPPGIKVASDEILGELLKFLRSNQQFDTISEAGPAPAVSGNMTSSLELREGDNVRHIAGRGGMPTDVQKRYWESKKAMAGIYNSVFGGHSGGDIGFDGPLIQGRN